MHVYEIHSDAAVKQEGWPQGIRTIYSDRRSPESVARRETTAAERRTRVYVEQRTGRGKGRFWVGIPSEYWPRG